MHLELRHLRQPLGRHGVEGGGGVDPPRRHGAEVNVAPGLRQHWSLSRLRQDGVTSREIEVLSLVGMGLTAAAVARRCGISIRTVHKHLEHAYAKLGCHDRLSAVMLLRDAGLLGLTSGSPLPSTASS